MLALTFAFPVRARRSLVDECRRNARAASRTSFLCSLIPPAGSATRGVEWGDWL